MVSRIRTSDDSLYSIHDPLSSTAFRGETDRDSYAYMRLAKSGQQIPGQRVVVYHGMGHTLLDFIWVSLLPIIHERVVDVLRSSGATGWSTYPVSVLDKEGTAASGYHGLSVIGRCQSIFLDAAHSKLVYVDYPMGLGPKYRGLHVMKDTWDGSDIFTCADGQTDFIIVTEKVHTAFLKANVKNVRLESIADVEVTATDRPFIPRQPDKNRAQ
jgi:hypothetical protein